MGEHTTFRFAAAGVQLELQGSAGFVRRHLRDLLPFVERVAGTGGPAEEAPAPVRSEPAAVGQDGLARWFAERVPEDADLSVGDAILVFALWMRSFRKFVFSADEIRVAFMEVGRREPGNLPQVLTSLEREHSLILGTERVGEYMLNTTGIERAKRIVQQSGAPATRGAGR